jgi:hypothetical protein
MQLSDWGRRDWNRIAHLIDTSEFDYRDDFAAWLYANKALWAEFYKRARLAFKYHHKARFSAMAIIQVIRWETMLQEKDITFKINNNHAPDMARCYCQTRHPRVLSFGHGVACIVVASSIDPKTGPDHHHVV